MEKDIVAVPHERIVRGILVIRGRKVMVDTDLAELYGVTTSALNQAVKRNKERFPEDFMFELNNRETSQFLKSQTVISKEGRGGRRRSNFYAFTEQGVAMLSSVLRSKRAILANVQIMRTFTRLRQLLETNQFLLRKVEAMENKYDENFKVVFSVIKQLIKEEKKPKRELGFDTRKGR